VGQLSTKPKALDLFCGAGGASMGLYRAGFDLTGVDIKPQPRYPFRFIQADALEFPLEGYDFIWASPPCQKYSSMTRGRWKEREHPDLVPAIRSRLNNLDTPFVIENVVGAELIAPFILCGTMFGLQTFEGSQLRRHRLFEAPWLALTPSCAHNDGSAIGVYGGGQHPDRRRPASIGVFGNAGGYSKRDDLYHYGIDARRQAMGIDWMTSAELSEAIPPAYSEFIGKQAIQFLTSTMEPSL
jgi:DNA (cytosine-5)-methyltransferase 1